MVDAIFVVVVVLVVVVEVVETIFVVVGVVVVLVALVFDVVIEIIGVVVDDVVPLFQQPLDGHTLNFPVRNSRSGPTSEAQTFKFPSVAHELYSTPSNMKGNMHFEHTEIQMKIKNSVLNEK